LTHLKYGRLLQATAKKNQDTTVQSLTIQPMLQNGVVIYQDSPLVSAVRHGRVLVIDEADKAPLEVVCILKSLVEDGEFAAWRMVFRVLGRFGCACIHNIRIHII